MKHPHFRIQHTTEPGQLGGPPTVKVYVTFPGLEEMELKSLRRIASSESYDGTSEVEITLLATYESHYN